MPSAARFFRRSRHHVRTADNWHHVPAWDIAFNKMGALLPGSDHKPVEGQEILSSVATPSVHHGARDRGIANKNTSNTR